MGVASGVPVATGVGVSGVPGGVLVISGVGDGDGRGGWVTIHGVGVAVSGVPVGVSQGDGGAVLVGSGVSVKNGADQLNRT